jgi:HSP20 family protein
MLWEDLNRMTQWLSEFAGEPATAPGLANAYPPVNLWEDDNNVYVEAELPGLAREQLEIYVNEGNRLTFQGERKPFEAKGVWHRLERGFGRFGRTVELPAPVEADKVEARFEQGVLFVTLPKSVVARPRRITVKSD